MICIDTNLLVYAHRAGLPEHAAARRALEQASRAGGWGITLASVVEFWSVVTHPASRGGASTATQARGFLRGLIDGGCRLWLPREGLAERLLDAAREDRVLGPRIFDLQIALTALDNGASELWTHDRHFVAVPGLSLRHPLR